jgi:tetratricopeptide (TPR) repeat protein
MRCLAKKPEQRYRNMGELEAALCAAQVDATLQTSWDDLPLPDEVDDELRDRLLREMPDMHETEPRRRRWIVPLIATLSLALGIGATYIALSRMQGNNTVAAPSKVEGLVSEARASAARSAFVYPPGDDPTSPSAFAKIRQLEQLGTDEARTAAFALRDEFSATLVSLGDSYWSREGGETFAVEYYKQALVFDRENARALERSETEPHQVDALAQRAEVGEFSAQELATAESLRELAEPDPVRRKELRARRAAQGDSAVAALLEKPVPIAVPTPATPSADAEDDDDEDEEEGPPAAAPKPAQVAASEQSGAEDLAATGAKLLEQGKRADAEEMFKLALTYDPNNATALRNVYKLELDRGNTKAALAYADLLLANAPNDAGNQVRAGDVRMKLKRYDEARTHYLRALELGATDAKTKLAKLDAISPPPAASPVAPPTSPPAKDEPEKDTAPDDEFWPSDEPAPAQPKVPPEAKPDGKVAPATDAVPSSTDLESP